MPARSRATVTLLTQPVSRLSPAYARALNEEEDLMRLYNRRVKLMDEVREIDRRLADGIARNVERRIACD